MSASSTEHGRLNQTDACVEPRGRSRPLAIKSRSFVDKKPKSPVALRTHSADTLPGHLPPRTFENCFAKAMSCHNRVTLASGKSTMMQSYRGKPAESPVLMLDKHPHDPLPAVATTTEHVVHYTHLELNRRTTADSVTKGQKHCNFPTVLAGSLPSATHGEG